MPFCHVAVWPAVGKAPNGKPDTSVRFGAKLAPKASTSFNVGDKQLVRQTFTVDIVLQN